MLSAMSVLVLEDLCFSFRSFPPNEAMVAVVSKDIMSAVWNRLLLCQAFLGGRGNKNNCIQTDRAMTPDVDFY